MTSPQPDLVFTTSKLFSTKINMLRDILNHYGKARIPCLFIIDFDQENFYVESLAKVEKDILFKLENIANYSEKYLSTQHHLPIHIKQAVSLEKYTLAFNQVIEELKNGNTYLVNLTFPTEVEVKATLLEIFHASQAPFKLYFKDQFVTFSPERFIKIQQNIIKTYPMKGTIDASLANARERILTNPKEMAEHTTVVDLLRNDLAIVAKQVKVQRFRYIDKINAGSKQLLQVSSEIVGILENHWQERLGDIVLPLLPAGSISGAPKRQTVEIIKTVEGYARGFFTGIFGYFDGKELDSAVMIRFLEKINGRLFYKSGGGITTDSEVVSEYQEMLDKIYFPTG
jgi:para-aminobenzoate synthetase component 1